MKIIITLGPTQDKNLLPLELTLKRENHSLAKRWSVALKEILESNKYLEKHNSLRGFPKANRNLKKITEDINKCINLINKFKWKDGFHITEQASDEMEQSHLNALHHYFEILTGLTWNQSSLFKEADQKTRVAILFYNHFIHEFEYKKRSIEKAKEFGDGSAACSLNFAFSACTHRDLVENDCSRFSLVRAFGDVVIHYSQLGKTYEEAFIDNDEVVQDQSINAHRYFTGEFDLFLGPSDSKKYQKKYKEKVYNWLKSKGIDHNDPKLCLGEARVARLVPTKEQKKWDVNKFQIEIGNRPNIIQIEMKDIFSKTKREYNYFPKESFERTELFFNTGSWEKEL